MVEQGASLTADREIPKDRILDIDIYDLPGAQQDFLLAWKAVQDEARFSLVWSPRHGGHWIATRGREIETIYTDHTAFSSRIVLVPRAWAEPFQVKPTTLDPPKHTPYRRLLLSALTPAAVETARPLIRRRAEAAVAAVCSQGACEVIDDVCSKIPLPVFLDLAALPPNDVARLPRYNAPLIAESDRVAGPDTMVTFADYLRPHCATRLTTPGTDLLSRLINGTVEGARLPLEDAVEMATTVMTGGIDTVISTLGLMLRCLAADPSLRAALAQAPGKIPKAVREMLRRYPIMTKARLVTAQRQIDGITLTPGELVVLPPLHGLDDALFDDPLTVDLERPAQPNLTFGAGVHRCPGSLLALAEIEILLEVWLREIPDFAVDPSQPPSCQSGVLGAVRSLHLVWPVP